MWAGWMMASGTALLGALPELQGVYVFCLIVGGGLLVISTVFGGHHDSGLDADAGADIDLGGGHVEFDAGGADVDFAGDTDVDFSADGHTDGLADAHADAHAGALGISNWLSLRFFVYFAAMFGLVGTVFTFMTDVSAGWTLAIALVAGIGVGQGVHQLIRGLQRTEGNSQSSAEDFVDQPARVTIAVRPPARGEIGVRMGNREVFLPAIARRDDDIFESGAQVVITSYQGGLAEVVSRREYEFAHGTS
jgi:hypothetical protein